MKESKDDYLTVRETAQMLKLTEVTIRRYISQGKIPSVKIGSKRFVVRSGIEQMIDWGKR